MAKKEKFIIPTKIVGDNFKEHLDIEDNIRILFSGKYGTGKTYFLNDFFSKEKDNYEIFHLYPINYQISSNDDVINFLKYDILVELLNKDKNNETSIFKNIEITSFLDYSILTNLFLSDEKNILEALKTGLKFIPNLGRPFSETIGLFEKFSDFKKEIGKGENGIIESFINEIKKKNINENDPISELVKERINEIKGDKKSVLILDDLDRIDPEHIFRLLNIFGAHFDNDNKELSNKFGFDKIILVCDYKNIKSIFEHKYGNADFNGYMDKFFSIDIFNFNNIMVESYIDEIIKEYKFESEYGSKEIKDNNLYYYLLTNLLLTKMLKINGKYKLNLRELLKPIEFEIRKVNPASRENEILIIDTIINLLKKLRGGDKKYLVETINILKNEKDIYKKHPEKILQNLYGYLIYHIYSKIKNYKYSEEFETYKEYKFQISEIQKGNIDIISGGSIKKLFYDIFIDYIENHLD